MYLYLKKNTEALADAKTLETIGVTDLSNILAIEGVALFQRAGSGDLDLAVRLFTIELQIEKPSFPQIRSWRSMRTGIEARLLMA